MGPETLHYTDEYWRATSARCRRGSALPSASSGRGRGRAGRVLLRAGWATALLRAGAGRVSRAPAPSGRPPARPGRRAPRYRLPGRGSWPRPG